MTPKKLTLLALRKYSFQLPFFLVVSFLLLFSFNNAHALIGINEPLIPCGLSEVNTAPCTFCHLFQLVQNIYNFIVFVIVPPLAIILVAVGGFYWLASGGSEARAKKGQAILIAVGTGLVIVYVSWLVIGFGITLIADTVTTTAGETIYDPTKWFQIDCSAEDEETASITLSLEEDSIALNETVRLDWNVAEPIDNAVCVGFASPDDPAGTGAWLTQVVQANRVGFTVLGTDGGFTTIGTHSYGVSCGSNQANVFLEVTPT